MLKLIIEFGRQRRKFDLIHPIDINLLENEIKLSFNIDSKSFEDYLIQIFDDEINEYLDLTSNSFHSIQSNLIKGQIICKQIHSSSFQNQVFKEDIVGLLTLESLLNSLQNWSLLFQNIQNEIIKQIENVKQTIVAVKSHYKLIDENENRTISNCSSPTSISQIKQYSINKQSTFNDQKIDQINSFPQKPILTKSIEYKIRNSVTYQRFESGVEFQGELCQYYNPTYFFVRIVNQKESYDEMHRDLNLFYNKNQFNRNYFPQSGDFCVAKCSNDLNWYRARIIRLIGNDKVQLIFIDNGQISEININFLKPLNKLFSEHPAQALACTLTKVLPFNSNDKCGWNKRACITFENTLINHQSNYGNCLQIIVDENQQAKWPMMFVNIQTENIQNVTNYMCDLYLSRRVSNIDLSLFWSLKIRPEQYVLFNLSSLINQKQYFILKNDCQIFSFDEILDRIIQDISFHFSQ